MKKTLILLSIIALFIGACCPNASAQTSQQITMNLADLTPAQRAQYEADIIIAKQKAQLDIAEQKIEQFGDWVGVGGEVGGAIKEGLEAVVDVADKFGKTDVGKFTLVLVAWKVMGKDVVKIILGLLFFGVFVFMLSRFYRRTITDRKILTKRTPQGFWKRPIKEYEVVESNLEGDEKAWLTAGIILAFLLSIWITYAVMF